MKILRQIGLSCLQEYFTTLSVTTLYNVEWQDYRCPIEFLPQNFHEGTEANHGELQDNRSPDRDYDRECPETNIERYSYANLPGGWVYLQMYLDL
jgi:hypothetical protein